MFVGIDVGTQSIKVVIQSGGEIVGSRVLITEEGGERGSRMALESLLEEKGLAYPDPQWVVATGIGRSAVALASKTRTEQLCHARAAHHWFRDCKTVLDIGAEGVRAMKLDNKGRLINFVCNRKCAAGTGSFLEVMADLLQTPIEKLEEYASGARQRERVSSYCTVFAESEVISHIHRGKSKEGIIAGIIASVAERSFELLQKIGLEPEVVLTGGVAQNRALHTMLEEMMGNRLLVAPAPQLAGAMGAALLAQDLAAKGSV